MCLLKLVEGVLLQHSPLHRTVSSSATVHPRPRTAKAVTLRTKSYIGSGSLRCTLMAEGSGHHAAGHAI